MDAESVSNEKSHDFLPVSKKRRSSLFQRQPTSPGTQETKKFKFCNENENSQKFDVENYIEGLKEEDKKWRELYNKRKTRAHNASKIYKNLQEGGQNFDLSCLTDSERAFLDARPDYEEFNKNLQQLHKFATKVAFLHLSSENLKDKAVSKLNSEMEEIAGRIINLEG